MRIASRVFAAIGVFAFAAAMLFLAVGHDRKAVQGTLILALFGLANMYLWRVLGHGGRYELDGLVVPGAASLDEVQHNDPDSLHLPGPSIFPLVYALSAGLILIGLFTHYGLSYAGLALFVIASAGWIREAVREHRFAQAHGGHDDHLGKFDHAAIELAHRIRAFGSAHGGATANVQHLGRGAARVVLVGADGEWGDLVTGDIAAAQQACTLAGAEAPTVWPSGLGLRMRTDRSTWEQMGGGVAPATIHGPRDGYLQVGARVFLSIGAFAFAASALFMAVGRSRSSIQGSLILAMFGIANVYLYVFMRNARGGPADEAYAAASGISAEQMDPDPAMNPDDIHLPGPSIWPAVFAIAAGMILIGLITNTYISLAGVGLFVLAAAGWIAQAVGEYRLAQSGGGHGEHSVEDGAVPVDHISAAQTH
ncbi:MAG: cytochrome c oxidase subunit 4 [Mycobacteriales bacterium]